MNLIDVILIVRLMFGLTGSVGMKISVTLL